MTFYHQQVLLATSVIYPDDDLCRQIIQAKNYIDDHFAENIDLEKIATHAFYSKYHFLRLFKTFYGTTPHQYLTSVRIARAKQLLKTGLTISQVCVAIGFDSITSFKQLFKRYTSLSPHGWQKKNCNKEIIGTTFKFLPFYLQHCKKSNFQSGL